MVANFRVAFQVTLTPPEQRWIARTIADSSQERDAQAAARLIAARVETLIRARLEPFAEFAADIIAYEDEHAECSDTSVRLAIAGDLLTMLKDGNA